MADERKRIIEFDAADSMPSDGNIAVDSAQQGTKKLTAIKMKEYVVGNTPLPTTAQTVTGAIAEVDGKSYKNQTCSQAEYNALPDTKNTDNTARFIHDGQPTSGLALWAKVGTAGLHTTAPDCSGAINELKSSLNELKTQLGSTTGSTSTVTFDIDATDKRMLFLVGTYRTAGAHNNDGTAIIKLYDNVAYITDNSIPTLTNASYDSNTRKVTLTVGGYMNVLAFS